MGFIFCFVAIQIGHYQKIFLCANAYYDAAHFIFIKVVRIAHGRADSKTRSNRFRQRRLKADLLLCVHCFY